MVIRWTMASFRQRKTTGGGGRTIMAMATAIGITAMALDIITATAITEIIFVTATHTLTTAMVTTLRRDPPPPGAAGTGREGRKPRKIAIWKGNVLSSSINGRPRPSQSTRP